MRAINNFLEEAPVEYKLKLLKALSKGVSSETIVNSDFLKYLEIGESFRLLQYEWSEKPIYKVNDHEISKSKFDAIKTISRHFFNTDEYILIICPKIQLN